MIIIYYNDAGTIDECNENNAATPETPASSSDAAIGLIERIKWQWLSYIN